MFIFEFIYHWDKETVPLDVKLWTNLCYVIIWDHLWVTCPESCISAWYVCWEIIKFARHHRILHSEVVSDTKVELPALGSMLPREGISMAGALCGASTTPMTRSSPSGDRLQQWKEGHGQCGGGAQPKWKESFFFFEIKGKESLWGLSWPFRRETWRLDHMTIWAKLNGSTWLCTRCNMSQVLCTSEPMLRYEPLL